MTASPKHFSAWFLALLGLTVLILVSGCNLSGSPEQQEIIQTETPALTLLPSRTPVSTSGLPATAQFPTLLPTSGAATAIIVVPTLPPTAILPPTSVFPLNIAILSPAPGNIVAGNVQVLGSSSHPQFLQYQLEFGPDPNPGNLWYPVNAPLFSPVLNGLLGVWNTIGVQDSRYQLRLRVYLRDGRVEQTVVSNITVQNRINTPVPSPTQAIPRPIAAFTQDVTGGQVPLTVRFINQSTGSISSIAWNFGDGTTSSEANPVHVFGSPGLYTVTLTVNGPGGSSNVSRQISVNSPSAPIVGFTQDRVGGVAPLTVQFIDQSSGAITSYAWNFSDGQISSERNPVHVFTTPGTYNVILTVTGPGGSSSVVRQISVSSAVPPTATFTATTTAQPTQASTNTFTPTSTGVPATATPTQPSTAVPPTDAPTATPTPLPTATSTDTPIPAPTLVAGFTFSGDVSNGQGVQFFDQTVGGVPPYTFVWDFSDGQISNEQHPYHLYALPGTYLVRLMVLDSSGVADDANADIIVIGPPTATHTETSAPPTATETSIPTPTSTETPIPPELLAGFAATPDAVNLLAVQFTDQTSGGIPPYAYTWDFGDGQISNEQDPLHIYASAGTYLVRLLALDSAGLVDDFSIDVVVTGPPPTAAPLPGTADLAPVIPDLGDPRIGQIFQAGAVVGNLPYSFAHIGGLPLAQMEVIRAFAPGKSYNLASQGDLQAVIDWFNQSLSDGTTSFSRSSVASAFDWTVNDLFDPGRANPSGCTPGETPLDCELRLTQPVIVFVSVGYNDVLRGMDPGTFEAQLRQIVATAAGRGVIPVLLSLPRSDSVDTAAAQGFNEVIFRVAQESGVPVLNVWRLLSEMPGYGSNGTSLSVSPSGEGDLDPSATGSYGVNAVNNALLRFLSDFRSIVLAGI